jgi:hypothetical protein
MTGEEGTQLPKHLETTLPQPGLGLTDSCTTAVEGKTLVRNLLRISICKKYVNSIQYNDEAVIYISEINDTSNFHQCMKLI